MVKLFLRDASFTDDGWVGMGVVARDEHGEVILVATRRITAWWPIKVSDGKALCFAMKLARSRDLRDVIFVSDCLKQII